MFAARTLLLVILGLLAAPCRALPDRALMLEKTNSVVRVQAFDADTRTYFGTGVVVAPQRVATNCHVTRHAIQVVVIFRGETLQVAGQLHDIDHDVCVLDVPLLRTTALRAVASNELRIGQPVWAMGFEGGAGIQFRLGIVRGLHLHDRAYVIESTTAFTSGASGGALMSEAGEVVGLLTYRLRGDRRSYFSVPMEWLPAGYQTVESSPVTPLRGNPFWQRTDDQLPEFLRAHRYVADADWHGLMRLTDRWLARDGQSAEAWWFQGRALEHSPQPASAAQAYRSALSIDPRFLPALMRLGRLSIKLGDAEAVGRITATLNALVRELGRCLDSPEEPTDMSTSTSRHENCNDF